MISPELRAMRGEIGVEEYLRLSDATGMPKETTERLSAAGRKGGIARRQQREAIAKSPGTRPVGNKGE